MANGRSKGKGASTSRDPGGFVALPWSVLDSDAYQRLSHPARSLLMELCRQYVRDNNGRLLASRAHLAKRGWKSADVIQRAKDELLAVGFIHETVKGQRPNKASWYALTFYSIDRLPGYDTGAIESFERGAYRKNAALCPSHGTESATIAPSHGTGMALPIPSHGTMQHQKRPPLCSVSRTPSREAISCALKGVHPLTSADGENGERSAGNGGKTVAGAHRQKNSFVHNQS